MKVEVENGAGLTRKLSVEIPAQTFNSEMEKKLTELRRTVTLKGFRKGNAPIDMIRSQFGDQVKADVVDELFRQSLSNAIDTHKMKIAGRPTVTDLDLAEDGTMTYKAEVEVFPEIEKVAYDGLTLQAPRLGRLQVPLLGRHQAANAAVALGIVAALAETGVAEVPDEAVVAGLARTRWPGRLEVLHHDGLTILLDGAHNPDGAAALAAAIEELAPHLPPGPVTLLLAIMADKAVVEVVAALAASERLREASCLVTRVPDADRSMPASDLAAAWATATGRAASDAIDDADKAFQRACELAEAAGGLLVITGSLYLVGHMRTRLVPDVDGS